MKIVLVFITFSLFFSFQTLLAQADTLWTQFYGGSALEGGYSLEQTPDGGYVIAGYTSSFGSGSYDVYLIRTNEIGDTIWTKTYGGSSLEEGRALDQTNDGGYVIVGTTYSYSVGFADVWLLKIDGNGDTLWTRTYGNIHQDRGYAVKQTNDNGYIIAGYATPPGFPTSQQLYLVKTDINGDTLWTKTYGGAGEETAWSVQQTQDNGYIVTGQTNSFGAGNLDAYVIRTDSLGNPIWIKTFGGADNEFGYSALQLADGGFLINAQTQSYGVGGDLYLIRTDSNGDTLWTKTLGGSGSDFSRSVQQLSDGFIFAGGSTSFGSGNSDVWILKTDEFCNPDWDLVYGGQFGDYAYEIEPTPDGGFITIGVYNTLYGPDIWLLKLGKSPQINAHHPIQNELNIPPIENLSVTFDSPINPFSINDTTFVVTGSYSGLHPGNITYDSVTYTANFNPYNDFEDGEIVTVVLTSDIESNQGVNLEEPYCWQFNIAVQAGTATFILDSSYVVGSGPYAPVVADFDNDNDLDLANVNSNSNNLSILLNNGDATFTLVNPYDIGSNPQSLLADDLDNDGDVDLATANRITGGTIRIILNNGDATFQVQSPFPAFGDDPGTIFSADIDSDGDQDLITSNAQSDNLSIFFNLGNANFAFQENITVGDASSVFAGDLDNDGDLDLTGGLWINNAIFVLMNNADGSFGPVSTYPVGASPEFVRTVDLDGDGDLDLTNTNHYESTASVYKNNGDGTFANFNTYAVSTAPSIAFPADLDNDGDMDLTIQNRENDNVSVLLNHGDGTFADQLHFATGDGPTNLLAADLEGDGDLDLVTVNLFSNSISILKNVAIPQILVSQPEQNELNVSTSSEISVIFSTDMDISSITNSTFIVNGWFKGLYQGTFSYDSLGRTATFNPNRNFAEGELVTVVLTNDIQSKDGLSLPNSYIWSFTVKAEIAPANFRLDAVYPVISQPNGIVSADLDNDDDLDLITANRYPNSIYVIRNNGDGTFYPDSAYMVGQEPISLCTADLNGDNHVDLAAANLNSANVSVLINNGDGTFGVQSTYPTGQGVKSIIAADLNGDGDFDLVTLNSYSSDFTVLLNNGDGTFITDSSFYVSGTNKYEIISTDFDNDGYLDIAISTGPDLVWIYNNDGNAIFSLDSTYQVYFEPVSIFSADLNIDGNLDLVTANYQNDNISVLLNYGDGTFGIDSSYATGDGPGSIFAADMDGDGDLDLANRNSLSQDISIHLNNGSAIFSPHLLYSLPDRALEIFSADLDGDGSLNRYLTVTGPPGNKVPARFAMKQNYPNPFNPNTTIEFDLPKTSEVTLRVFNILGEEVATLLSASLLSGTYKVDWDASNLASGVYLYRLEAEGFVKTRKMILMR
jgi:hypothetical protein